MDDEPVNLVILEELLHERYRLLQAPDGETCLRQVAEHQPDMILLDVSMPQMDGLETCRRLKSDAGTADIPIIFVSALASPEELMQGYEAGGDDYLTKPFSEEILCKKIELALASQRRKAELKRQTASAVEALIRTRSTSEDLGVVIQFLDRLQRIASLEEAADGIFECLRELELDGSLLLLDGHRVRIRFSDDIERPMESQILESLRGQDRVVNFGTRLAISSDTATLLVRNLPTEAQQVQSLRGQLTILLGALDGRIHALGLQARLEDGEALLDRLREATTGWLESVAALRDSDRQAAEDCAAIDALRQQCLAELELGPGQQAVMDRLFDTARTDVSGRSADLPDREAALLELIEDIRATLEAAQE